MPKTTIGSQLFQPKVRLTQDDLEKINRKIVKRVCKDKECVRLFGRNVLDFIIFQETIWACCVLASSITEYGTRLCRVSKNCGYLVPVGRRNKILRCKIDEYADNFSMDALGIAATLAVAIILQKDYDVTKVGWFVRLQEFATAHLEADKIKMAMNAFVIKAMTPAENP